MREKYTSIGSFNPLTLLNNNRIFPFFKAWPTNAAIFNGMIHGRQCTNVAFKINILLIFYISQQAKLVGTFKNKVQHLLRALHRHPQIFFEDISSYIRPRQLTPRVLR